MESKKQENVILQKNVIEFERKFLVVRLPVYLSFNSVELIDQYYIGEWRYRQVHDAITKEFLRAEFIKKVRIETGHNVEVTPLLEQEELIYKLRQTIKDKRYDSHISKTRYTHLHSDGLKYEFDLFHTLKELCVLEIETPEKDTPILFDKKLAPFILCEVTNIDEFSNQALSLKPKFL